MTSGWKKFKAETVRNDRQPRDSLPALMMVDLYERMVNIMANTVKLQGIYGQQKGTAVKDLKVGDVIVWNFGYKSQVMALIPSKTGKTITAMLKSLASGDINPRKMGAERLVVIA